MLMAGKGALCRMLIDPVPPRRGAGELEGAVLAVLWEADAALSPGRGPGPPGR
jgi:hypothetical protein